MAALLGKIIIEGKIKAITGLHIGGTKSVLEVGGIDNNIIKTKNGKPYIPGSSLKGKLRNMLARVIGSEKVDDDNTSKDNISHVHKIFGLPSEESDKTKRNENEALLKVRDAYVSSDYSKATEQKMENSIKRLTGEANPRTLERVPEGTCFDFQMILDVYDEVNAITHLKELSMAMQLLQHDHLGGSGSRGSGRVEFDVQAISYKKIDAVNLKIGIDSNWNTGGIKEMKETFKFSEQ
jgi:CRISPR-associated protein Csm3